MRGCQHEGCERPHWAHGLCNLHYSRFKRTGTSELLQRTTAPCLAADCEEPVYSNGLCTTHYQRLRTSGRLEHATVAERILASYEVDDETGCWLWQQVPDAAGYGRISVGNQNVYAHRASYETFIGPIPEGLTIDHVRARGCVHKTCINPAHLEPVTLAENVRREMAARSNAS